MGKSNYLLQRIRIDNETYNALIESDLWNRVSCSKLGMFVGNIVNHPIKNMAIILVSAPTQLKLTR